MDEWKLLSLDDTVPEWVETASVVKDTELPVRIDSCWNAVLQRKNVLSELKYQHCGNTSELALHCHMGMQMWSEVSVTTRIL